jgi:hypothetical protein
VAEGNKGSYDYVIVTTHAIVDTSLVLADFVNHKEDLGFSVYVATEDDYEEVIGPPPNGRAEKIRQWLINNYLDMGIKYVLLIGNPDPDHPIFPKDSVGDIPMKTLIDMWDFGNPGNMIASFLMTFFLKGYLYSLR